MENVDELVGNLQNDNSVYCFCKKGEIYLVYLPNGGSAEINLEGQKGDFEVSWFNPRSGGNPVQGNVKNIKGGSKSPIGEPPYETSLDWLAVIKRSNL
ncbi:MAG: putative collagen-binding domain-containing protein [Verrucomicrobiia bacterium]